MPSLRALHSREIVTYQPLGPGKSDRVFQRIQRSCRRMVNDDIEGLPDDSQRVPLPYGWAIDDAAYDLRCKKEESIAVSCKLILNVVSEVAEIPVSVLKGRRQHKPIARVRQICYLLMRTHCPWRSFTEIGSYLCRDHSSVLSGVRKAEDLLESDPDFYELHKRCLAALKAT